MAEPMIREAAVESQRLRDRLEDQNRTANIEKALAVLQTRFEAWLERAVSGDDLKDLKREMEEEVNKQMREVLGEFRTILTTEQLAQSQALLKANNDTRKEIIRYGIGFALTVLSALVIFWLTTRV